MLKIYKMLSSSGIICWTSHEQPSKRELTQGVMRTYNILGTIATEIKLDFAKHDFKKSVKCAFLRKKDYLYDRQMAHKIIHYII